ncbi:MAG: hypothetical protein OEZ31_05975 [Nitrospirota bacterium]|nr:hypothetical protein [Nitrospirota bacterium]MDH5768490.1 hypothetical protein [Nitrospirota bacterium]
MMKDSSPVRKKDPHKGRGKKYKAGFEAPPELSNGVYAEYEIPSVMRASVLSIDSLKKVDELSAQEAVRESAELKGLIDRYDAVVPLGITKDYIERRGFDAFKSFRELIQNALDEIELITGKPEVNIKKDSIGTWIIDSGRGLKVEALSIGGTDKECWMRGYYGEGLKLASAYFAFSDVPLYVFARHHVFKFVAIPKGSDNPRIFVLMGKANKEVGGTEILLHGFSIDDDVLNRMVSFCNRDLVGKKIAEIYSTSEECAYEKPSAIYDYPNLLYIRNMFVGDLSDVARRRSLLSYDLWWFRLDVSRTLMTYSVPKLFEEAAKIFSASGNARKKLTKKLIDSKMLTKRTLGTGVVMEFRPIFSIFEGHLFVYAFPKGMLEAILEALGLEDKKHLIARATGEEDMESAVKLGVIPFIISEELSDEFKQIPPLSDMVKKVTV